MVYTLIPHRHISENRCVNREGLLKFAWIMCKKDLKNKCIPFLLLFNLVPESLLYRIRFWIWLIPHYT